DFVFSFPLVIWLLARSDVWREPNPPSWPTAIAYGAMLGYSAALNPVGAEWLFPSLVVLGLANGGLTVSYLRHAVPRWIGALLVGILFVTPDLWGILSGGGARFVSSGGVGEPAPTGELGISPARLVGSIDPFLFRSHDLWLSPFPALRLELAGLLIAGAAVLLFPRLFRQLGPQGPRFRQLIAATFSLAIVFLLVEAGAAQKLSALESLALISSAAEVSVYLFAIYTILAALPLYLLIKVARGGTDEGLARSGTDAPNSSNRERPHRPRLTGPRAIGIVLVVGLIIPGIVVTGVDFPSYLQGLYGSYGRVTAGDFALFAWAGHGFPAGARVLVAPGSAAQFLPGYANVALVFPVQRIAQNTSYVDLDRQLVHGNLTASGFAELAGLSVQYIAVTGNTTDLWAPFSPTPLLGDPSAFGLLFQDGDAYVFLVRG
ncbi:MAG: hypothetical protein L3J97_06985, partial [Thermoplasmata archaeon]|nr:hypothetical protein [Thermoplasmata archaeon]